MNSNAAHRYSPLVLPDTGKILIPPVLDVPLLRGIPSRGITPETCQLYRTYGTVSPIEVVHHYFSHEDSTIVGIKHRKGGWTSGKKDTWWEEGSKRSLFGSHLYEGQASDVYITEGETDTMALSQAIGSDGLCLAYGGKPSDETLESWVQFILKISEGFKVYLCFDADEEGEKYKAQFLRMWKGSELQTLCLPPNTKDVAQLLLDGGTLSFSPLVYSLPENLLTGDALIHTHGLVRHNTLTTGHRDLDWLLGGYESGGIIVLAGPTKQGKTAFVVDLVVKFLHNHTGNVMVVPLELNVDETMQLIAAASLGCHISEVDEEALLAERARLAPRILMVKHFGFMTIDDMNKYMSCIPYFGVKLFVLDHITSACTSFHEGLTTNLLDAMMSFIQSKLNEFRIPAIVVTHTNASGGDILHVGAVRGSQSICQMASALLGIRRLESGLSEVYTIVPTRFTGKMGRVQFEFNGRFESLNRKTYDL